MAQRVIEGPSKDLLKLAEVLEYLRLDKRTFHRLIARGKFPRPLLVSARTPVWAAEDVIWYRLRIGMADRLRRKRTPEGAPATPKTKKS